LKIDSSKSGDYLNTPLRNDHAALSFQFGSDLSASALRIQRNHNKMKKPIIVLAGGICVLLIAGALWLVDDSIAPLFLNSRIERLGERGLPSACVEKGGVVYCRMKADDFRFPLPPDSHPVLPVTIAGGFDTVDGSVEVRFDGTKQMTESEYLNFLSARLQIWGSVRAERVSGGLLIKFHYFGDK